jgi:hypothetical protein
MMYDVMVMNEFGVWSTDTTTGSQHRASERAKTLMPRVPACKVMTMYGERFFLEGF